MAKRIALMIVAFPCLAFLSCRGEQGDSRVQDVGVEMSTSSTVDGLTTEVHLEGEKFYLVLTWETPDAFWKLKNGEVLNVSFLTHDGKELKNEDILVPMSTDFNNKKLTTVRIPFEIKVVEGTSKLRFQLGTSKLINELTL